jgi:DNA-binding NarL/FixJ family response regulator
MPIDHEKLTGLIYDGIQCDDAWRLALHTIADATKSLGVGLGVQDMHSHAFRGLGDFGIDTALTEVYREHAPKNHVWRAIGSFGRPLADQMVLPKPQFARSALYRAWFVPQRFHSVMAAPAVATGTACTVVVAFRGRAVEDFGETDLEWLGGIGKHFGRALAVRLDHEQLRSQIGAAWTMLDAVQDALVLVDRLLRVRGLNGAAEAVLQRGDAFRLRGDVLCLSDAKAARRLLALMQAGHGGTLPVARARGPAMILRVVPGQAGADGCSVLRFSDTSAPGLPPTPDFLQGFLGVSAGEARTVCALLDAGTEAAAARQLGVAPATVHENVQRLYGKLGFRSRADLTAALARAGIETGRTAKET